MWTDTTLQVDVENELNWDPMVHTRQIGVQVKNGEVILEGHVDSYAQRCAAERAAWRVAHVKSVRNELRVELAYGDQRDDDDIAITAMTMLEWNALLPASVEVQVSSGCATLSGSVESHWQKQEAERAVSSLRGLRGIENKIQVKPGTRQGDVKGPIEDAMRRSALINSAHIKVHVVHEVVKLQGTAGSRAEYQAAMEAALSAPGVAAVEEHITIGNG